MVLGREEVTNELFRRLNIETSEEIRGQIMDDIINENKDFVWFILHKYYGRSLFLRCAKMRMTPDDIYAVGLESMYKAVCNFDITRGLKFTTLAGTIIYRNVYKVFRDSKKRENDYSLDKALFYNSRGEEATLLQLLPNQKDCIESYIESDTNSDFLKAFYETLDDREKHMLFMRFHLDMTQKEIAKELGISQMHTSRLLIKLLAKGKKVHEDLERGALV